MKTGLTSVTFRGLSCEDIVALTVKAGLSCIEWGGDIHVKPGDAENAKRVKKLTVEAGLEVSSYGSYYRANTGMQEELSAVVDTAATLGAKIIRIWMGDKSSSACTEGDFFAIVGEVKAACKLAAAYGMTIAGEFHNNTYNDTAESCLRLIKAVDEENFMTYWQPVTYDEMDLSFLEKIKEHICVFHVFFWDKNGKRYPLKKGEGEWGKYLSFKNEKKSPKYAVMEFVKKDSKKQFLKDAAVLKSILE